MQYFLVSSSRIHGFQTWTPSFLTTVNEDTTVFGCVKPEHAIRRRCRQFVRSRYTQGCWVALVCLSTGLLLAVQPRYDMGDATYKTFFALQIVCLTFFWVRMLAEIFASGLVEGSHSFLRSLWNWLEVVVNVFGILQVIPPTFHIRWMRSVAAARPLRFFVFVPWWRQLLVPVARTFPSMLDVFFMFVLCTFSFALIGVFSVGEALYQRCYITQSTNATGVYASLELPFLLQNVTTPCGTGFTCPQVDAEVKVECLVTEAGRTNRFFTYQNVGTSLLLMLKVSSLDMWHEDLENIMNVKGSAAALYFVAVVVVGQFLLVVVMTMVYNAYSHLDSWFMQSTVTAKRLEESHKKDCGVQTVPMRPHQHQHRQPSPWPGTLRSTRHPSRLFSVDDCVADEHEMTIPNPLGVPGSTFTAHEIEENVAAAERMYARDFVRVLHVRGVWAALQELEQTTTAGNGKASRVWWAAAIVDSLPMAVFLILLSVGNLVLLALVSVYTSPEHARDIRLASAAMAIFFLVPIVLKLVAFGFTRTAKDLWNYGDVAGAVSGILEVAAPDLFLYRNVCIVRVLRYVHVGKYVFSFRTYHYQLQCLLQLLFLSTVFLLLFTALGMQLFGGTYTAGPGGAVYNGDFTTFWTALLVCFRICTGDVWTLYLLAIGDNGSVTTGSLFCVSIGLFALLTWFALGNSILFRGFRDAARDEDVLNCEDFPPLLLLPPVKDSTTSHTTATGNGVKAMRETTFTGRTWWWCGATRRRPKHKWLGMTVQKVLHVRKDAFFSVSPANPLRVLLLRIFGSLVYTAVSSLCIVMGLVALFLERRHLSQARQSALKIVNYVYFALFFLEMLMKWVAYGVFSPGAGHVEDDDDGRVRTMPAYFREPLNWIDFAANCLALAAMPQPTLRVGRIIRTVRLCTTPERPNKTFLTLIASLRHVVCAVPLIFFMYAAFAVAAMQAFAGHLHYCTDATVKTKAECQGNYSVAVSSFFNLTASVQSVPRVWERVPFHYDAFGPAVLSVFAMTTITHHSQFMDEAMAIGSDGYGMSYNHSGYNAFFFIAAQITIRFYALRIVGSVLAAKLRRSTMDKMGMALLTAAQTRFAVSRQQLAFMLYLNVSSLPRPYTASRLCHRVLTACPPNAIDPLFTYVLNVVLIVVCGFTAATHVYASEWQDTMLLSVECVAVGVCGIELLLCVVAYGLTDLFTVSRLADALLFAAMTIGVSSGETLAFFRVAVFVKLLKTSNVCMQLLPAVRHVNLLCSALAVCFLVLLTYAVVGTIVFGDIAPHGAYLTEKRNFHTVIGSLLMLFDCGTWDQWHLIMYACFDGAACASNPTAVCGHTYAAVIFFVSFVVVMNMISAPLLFAAMVNAFTVPLYVDVVQPFVEVRRLWLRHVGGGELLCDFDTFMKFLPLLPATLTDGVGSAKATESEMMVFMSALRLPLDTHLRLSYADLLCGLAYRKYKLDLIESTTPLRHRPTLSGLTAGEHYGQLLRRRYCEEITRLAQSKVEAVHLGQVDQATKTARGTVPDSDTLHVHNEEYVVPKGGLPIPNSNIFLFTFPEEFHEDGRANAPR